MLNPSVNKAGSWKLEVGSQKNGLSSIL